MIATVMMTACGNEPTYDAMGRFEAVDIVVSAEMGGKILNFDVEEGNQLKAGEEIGVIDTMQLFLQRNQIMARLDAQLQSRPDIRSEAQSLRTQITKQKKRNNVMNNCLKQERLHRNNMMIYVQNCECLKVN